MNKRNYKFYFYVTFDGRIPRTTDNDLFAKGDKLTLNIPKKYKGKESTIVARPRSKLKILIEVHKKDVDVMVSVAFTNKNLKKQVSFRRDELFGKRHERHVRSRLKELAKFKHLTKDAQWAKHVRNRRRRGQGGRLHS
jgi:uncharacterized membrane protein